MKAELVLLTAVALCVVIWKSEAAIIFCGTCDTPGICVRSGSAFCRRALPLSMQSRLCPVGSVCCAWDPPLCGTCRKSATCTPVGWCRQHGYNTVTNSGSCFDNTECCDAPCFGDCCGHNRDINPLDPDTNP